MALWTFSKGPRSHQDLHGLPSACWSQSHASPAVSSQLLPVPNVKKLLASTWICSSRPQFKETSVIYRKSSSKNMYVSIFTAISAISFIPTLWTLWSSCVSMARKMWKFPASAISAAEQPFSRFSDRRSLSSFLSTWTRCSDKVAPCITYCHTSWHVLTRLDTWQCVKTLYPWRTSKSLGFMDVHPPKNGINRYWSISTSWIFDESWGALRPSCKDNTTRLCHSNGKRLFSFPIFHGNQASKKIKEVQTSLIQRVDLLYVQNIPLNPIKSH